MNKPSDPDQRMVVRAASLQDGSAVPSAPLSAQVPPLVEVECVVIGNEEEDHMRRTMEEVQKEMIARIEQEMFEMICGPRVVRGKEIKAARADNE